MSTEDKYNTSTKNNRLTLFNEEDERDWKGDFTFIQAADTQFGQYERFILKNTTNITWEREIAWSSQLVKDLNDLQPKPRFLIICGDLLDAYPQTMNEMRMEQERDFKKVFDNLQIPCVCVCGNHDVGEKPTVDSVMRYRSSFGDDFFSFWCGGIYCIVLNSQYYEAPTLIPDLVAEQDLWLENQLQYIKETKPVHSIVFQHIPYFISNPHEENQYFNFEPTLRIKLLEKLYLAGVRHIFTGHYHKNAGGMYKEMEQVVTSAVGTQLGNDKQGYRVVSVKKMSIHHEYVDIQQ